MTPAEHDRPYKCLVVFLMQTQIVQRIIYIFSPALSLVFLTIEYSIETYLVLSHIALFSKTVKRPHRGQG